MGYGSASELLLRRSPDLYESFDEWTTPDYSKKGKVVCIDDVRTWTTRMMRRTTVL
jgi:hypothetical protein